MAVDKSEMHIEGDFSRDGFVIIRNLFSREWVQRMLPILASARETYRWARLPALCSLLFAPLPAPPSIRSRVPR